MSTLAIATDVSTNSSTASKYFEGGPALVIARGTWGGATLKIEVCENDDGTFVPLRDDSGFTADGAASFGIIPPCWIRATVSGVGTTSVSALIIRGV